MNRNLDELINETGRSLGQIWRRHEYDDHAFPGLAADVLAHSGLHEVLDMMTLARWSIATRPHPSPGPNMGTSFGEPPVTLYTEADAGFAIEALVWLDGTTAIHDHSFAGAFMVAQGSSIHTQFSFDSADRVRAKLQFGNVKWSSSELLSHGQIRRIEPGQKFIHSLFHLDRPSVTIVARTGISAGVQQYSYNPPSVAFDAFYRPEPLVTQMRMLASLMTVDKYMLQEVAELQLEDADLWTTREVLAMLYPHRHRIVDWDKLAKGAAERHGESRASQLISSFAEVERMSRITTLRRRVKAPDHRYFLALLLNVPDRSAILHLIAKRYPDVDPAEQAIEWLQELADMPKVDLELSSGRLDLLRSALSQDPSSRIVAREAAEVDQETRDAWDYLRNNALVYPLLRLASDGR